MKSASFRWMGNAAAANPFLVRGVGGPTIEFNRTENTVATFQLGQRALGVFSMRRSLAAVVVAMPAMLLASSPPSAKGCIKGALVGGVAGHYAHHHAITGAAAGCAAGHRYYKHKETKAAAHR